MFIELIHFPIVQQFPKFQRAGIQVDAFLVLEHKVRRKGSHSCKGPEQSCERKLTSVISGTFLLLGNLAGLCLFGGFVVVVVVFNCTQALCCQQGAKIKQRKLPEVLHRLS